MPLYLYLFFCLGTHCNSDIVIFINILVRVSASSFRLILFSDHTLTVTDDITGAEIPVSVHTTPASTVYFWVTPACTTVFQSTLACCTMGASWSNQTCPVIPEISVVLLSMSSSALSPFADCTTSCRTNHLFKHEAWLSQGLVTGPDCPRTTHG